MVAYLGESAAGLYGTGAFIDYVGAGSGTVEPVAPAFSHVVVAQVREVIPHPNASRLNVCQVDTGERAFRTIVCGASNVQAGMKVPCALPGAVLPSSKEGAPLEIRVSELRGVESQGMLCAAAELGLIDEQPGLLTLPIDAPVGQDFRLYYQLDDHIFTIKLTRIKPIVYRCWALRAKLQL